MSSAWGSPIPEPGKHTTPIVVCIAAGILLLGVISHHHGNGVSPADTFTHNSQTYCETFAEQHHTELGQTAQGAYDQCRADQNYVRNVLGNQTIDTSK